MLTPETKKTLRLARELINKMLGINAENRAPDVIVMTDVMYEHLCDRTEPVSVSRLFIGGRLILDGILVKHFPTPEICQTQATWMKTKGMKVLLIEEPGGVKCGVQVDQVWVDEDFTPPSP